MKVLYINKNQKFFNINNFGFLNRGLFQYLFNHLIVESTEEKFKLKKNEILIKNLACGICSTDIDKIINPKKLFHINKKLNRKSGKHYLGHEVVGKIIACGSKNLEYLLNSRVTIVDLNICKSFGIKPECENCKVNCGVYCQNKSKRKFDKEVYAGLSDFMIRTKNQIKLVPKSINDTSGIFIEPLATAINCAKYTNKKNRLIINGLTTISFLFYKYITIRKKISNKNIFFKVNNSIELKYLKKFNINCGLEYNDLNNFDQIYDFKFKNNNLDRILKCLKNKSTYFIFGTNDDFLNLDLNFAINKEISIKTIHGYGKNKINNKNILDVDEAINTIKDKKFDVSSLITSIHDYSNMRNKLIDLIYSVLTKKNKQKVFFRTVFKR